MTGVRAFGRGVTVALLGAATVYGHFLYPIYIGMKSRGAETKEPEDPAVWPPLSIVVPAYREAAVIGAKLDELAKAAYPGELEVVVVADDSATADAARRPGVRVMFSGQRLGKARAVNHGVAAACHDIVVLTDANAELGVGALKAAARHFGDQSVGAVAGEKRVDDPAGAQSFYWRFESWIKRCESATGQTIGVVGEMLAFRRSAFTPLPKDTAVDDAWLALDMLEAGLRVVYEPQAYSVEVSTPTFADEWERRTRIVTGNLDMLWRRRAALVPGALPVTSQLWGHRLVRSSFGPVAHVALVAMSVPAARHGWLARVFLAGNTVGVASMAAMVRGWRLPAPARLLAQVFFLQAVALGGIYRYLSRDSAAIWPKPERQAPMSVDPGCFSAGSGRGDNLAGKLRLGPPRS